uniref:PBPe domain-containing protein n=1 Tax=Schistocephalus solidus TaxID=70667 RepID=A0A183SIE6_SCHSO
LKEDTLAYASWLSPGPLTKFSIYMYNITNPNEILHGQRPRLQEVGPYVYWYEVLTCSFFITLTYVLVREISAKENVTPVTFGARSSLSYMKRTTYTFDRSLSVGDPSTAEIISLSLSTLFPCIPVQVLEMRPHQSNYEAAEKNLRNAGFCALDPSGPQCPPQGLFSIASCKAPGAIKPPLFASLPHFLYADRRLQLALDGIRPDNPRYDEIRLLVEPTTVADRKILALLHEHLYEVPTRILRILICLCVFSFIVCLTLTATIRSAPLCICWPFLRSALGSKVKPDHGSGMKETTSSRQLLDAQEDPQSENTSVRLLLPD